MAVVTSSQIGREVCEALGLDPKRVRSLTLKLRSGEPVIVEVEEFADLDVRDFTRVLRRYELHERTEEVEHVPPAPRPYDPVPPRKPGLFSWLFAGGREV